ncbi:MAG: AraC family transcriptional regulator [Cyanobacteria bacterium P01_D01_bin.44]
MPEPAIAPAPTSQFANTSPSEGHTHQFGEVDIYYAPYEAPKRWPEHHHRAVQVSILMADAVVETTHRTLGGKAQQQANADHVLVIPPYQPHAICWQSPAPALSLYLGPDLITQAAYGAVDADSLNLRANYAAKDPFIQQLGKGLKAELQQGMPSRLYVESLANVMAVHLARTYAVPHKSTIQKPVGRGLARPVLQTVIDYIQAHLSQDLSLGKLAEVAALSESYFIRQFKKSVGVSPHQYVLQCRVKQAQQLLKQPQLSIATVSVQAGFKDQNHLTRTFRRLTGTTPKAYRNGR